MTNGLIDIADTFAVFHDGGPEDWEIKGDNLAVNIYCPYIAELISSNFEYFHLEIQGLKTFKYVPWTISDKELVEVTDLSQINKCDFEIIDTEINEEIVNINCHEHKSIFNTPGGNFFIDAENIVVKTESNRIVNTKDLQSLSKKYWDNFGKNRI